MIRGIRIWGKSPFHAVWLTFQWDENISFPFTSNWQTKRGLMIEASCWPEGKVIFSF